LLVDLATALGRMRDSEWIAEDHALWSETRMRDSALVGFKEQELTVEPLSFPSERRWPGQISADGVGSIRRIDVSRRRAGGRGAVTLQADGERRDACGFRP